MLDIQKMDEQILENVVSSSSEELQDAKSVNRIRSEAVFPYASLEDAQTIVQAMRVAGDVPMTRDQIHAKLSVGRSLFVSKLSAAIIFGLVVKTDKVIRMTSLAHRMLSSEPDTAAQARVSALLTPEVYRKVIEHFRGKQIPGREGLENAFQSFGVSERQKERARQVFERSAIFAEYLNSARDRLVAPVIQSASPAASEFPVIPSNAKDASESDPSDEKLIRGMLDLLPKAGSEWKAADRARWLRRLSNNLAAIYDPNDETEIEIAVKS